MTHRDPLVQTIFDIAKVGAQKYVSAPNAILCEDCDAPATLSWAIPIAPWAEHLCLRCAERRQDRAYEGPQDASDVPPRAEND